MLTGTPISLYQACRLPTGEDPLTVESTLEACFADGYDRRKAARKELMQLSERNPDKLKDHIPWLLERLEKGPYDGPEEPKDFLTPFPPPDADELLKKQVRDREEAWRSDRPYHGQFAAVVLTNLAKRYPEQVAPALDLLERDKPEGGYSWVYLQLVAPLVPTRPEGSEGFLESALNLLGDDQPHCAHVGKKATRVIVENHPRGIQLLVDLVEKGLTTGPQSLFVTVHLALPRLPSTLGEKIKYVLPVIADVLEDGEPLEIVESGTLALYRTSRNHPELLEGVIPVLTEGIETGTPYSQSYAAKTLANLHNEFPERVANAVPVLATKLEQLLDPPSDLR